MSNDHTQKFIVYKVTNLINGKIYIGQTRATLERRKQQHKSRSRRKNIHLSPFHKALSDDGFENFNWEILEEVSDEKTARERETFYIKHLNSIQEGYNTNYGDGCPLGRKLSQESIEKIRSKTKNVPRPHKRGANSVSSKKYIITTPNGEEYFTHGLIHFCDLWKQDKLYDELLIKVAKGIRKHHKGYKCRYFDEIKDCVENYKQLNEDMV